MDLDQMRFFEGDGEEKAFFEVENWKLEGKELARAARDVRGKANDVLNQTGKLQWQLGDWLIEGEVTGQLKERRLKKLAAEATGYQWNTLKNLKVIALRFPPSLRVMTLSWSIHKEVSTLDEEHRKIMLDWVENRRKQGQDTSVRELRQYVRERSKKRGEVKTKKGGFVKAEWVQIPLLPANYKFFNSLDMNWFFRRSHLDGDQYSMVFGDFNRFSTVPQILYLIVSLYWAEHADEIRQQMKVVPKDTWGPPPGMDKLIARLRC